MNQLLRDLIFSLSLANLCFLRVWTLLVDPSARYSLARPTRSEYVAVMLAVGILGAILFSGLALVRRAQRPLVWWLARCIFAVLLFLPLNAVRIASLRLDMPRLVDRFGPWVLPGTVAALGLLCVLVIVRWPTAFARAAAIVVVVLSPLAAMLFATGMWRMLHLQPESGYAGAAPLAPQTGRPRVVWLVFDELDERLAFVQRPAFLKLPELDRLRAESLFAANAFPPAHSTVRSVSSLLTGKAVFEAKPSGDAELMITYQGSTQAVPWSAEPNVFARVRREGLNTALVGWVIPYCRILKGDLTFCASHLPGSGGEAGGLGSLVLHDFRELVYRFPLGWRLSSPEDRARHRRMHLAMLDDASRVATDPALGLVLIHWCIPHAPFVYSTGDRWAMDGSGDYLGNLLLVDRTLGELRKAMERAGVWDSTTLLVSSDHGLRPTTQDADPLWGNAQQIIARPGIDPRVPFLVKLAGYKTPLSFDSPLNTVLSSDLVVAVLRGNIATPEDLSRWIDQNRRYEPGMPASQQTPSWISRHP
jgi:hypothetical protein